jgi:hypothetical protein
VSRSTILSWLVLLVACALWVGVFPAAAHDAAPRFEMPFACGQTWQGATYSGHGTEDLALDFNRGQGSDDLGAPVVASASGIFHRVVNEVGGNSSNLDHGNGWITIYGHLEAYAVADGTPVARGQTIGYVGATGRADAPHLHYEQRRDDVTEHVAFSGVPIGTEGSPDPGYSYVYNGPDYTSRNCGRDPVPAPAVAALSDGVQLFAAIAADGTLVTRLDTPDGVERTVHGEGRDWRTVEVVAHRDAHLWMVGVDSTRTVFARRWSPKRGWGRLTQVTTRWSQDTTPSIATRPGGGIVVVGVDTSRNLEQYEWTRAEGWTGPTSLGRGWERATVVRAGPRLWLFGLQPDGDLLARKWTKTRGWSEFEVFGTGDWAVSVPPAAVARPGGMVTVFAVKADGRMYQRNWHPERGWRRFIARGAGESWLSVAATFSDGVVAYVGQTYDRRLVSGVRPRGSRWSEGIGLGGPEWSALRPVGLGPRPSSGVTMLAVTSEGELLFRHWTERRGWLAWFGRPGGATTWAKA